LVKYNRGKYNKIVKHLAGVSFYDVNINQYINGKLFAFVLV